MLQLFLAESRDSTRRTAPTRRQAAAAETDSPNKQVSAVCQLNFYLQSPDDDSLGMILQL